MAISADTEGHLVKAPFGDKHGFSEAYQTNLRARIIGEHVAPMLGSIPRIETIPASPIMKQGPNHERDLVVTHVAQNLQTSNDRMGRRNEPNEPE